MVNYLITKLQDYFRQKRVEDLYYHDEYFASIDRKILSGPNPFKISKSYLQERGEDNIYQYGETPLETLEKIGKMLELQLSDHLMEMGSGRGRGVFFLHHFFCCRVTGVEQIPAFVTCAKKTIKSKYVQFRCEDILKTSLDDVTCIYLCGTCLDDSVIEKLAKRLAKTPLRIATTSYPMPGFEIIDQQELQFPWGKTTVYVTKTPAEATCAR